MKHFVCVALLSMAATSLFAQTKITGIVVDSAGQTLPGASLVLLQQSDSVLQSFTTSNKNGKFIFTRVPSGSYILQVSYLGYQTYSQNEVIGTDRQEYSLGSLTLRENSQILDEVAISADRIPIIIKEDTIEYNAAAFQTKPNASVEELLKRLPGVEVETDGTIKAQGETVNKVLVDGKEFFGNDPKLATRNLASDAVDKVQVFDKLSEMAEFSGIDDGNRDKTINLKLKDDRKSGVFGKITGGYGSQERYLGKASINKFNKTTQVSFLGSGNNTNQQDFSIRDYISFNGGLSQLAGNGGGISLEGIGGALGPGNNSGINTSKSAGVNVNHDFKDKSELNLSYFFNGIDQDLIRSATRDNFINTQTFSSVDSSTSLSQNYNHRLNLRFKKTINEKSDITLRSKIGITNGEVKSRSSQQSFDSQDLLQNQSEQSNNLENDSYDIKTSALYRRKFTNRGRVLTANVELGLTNADGQQSIQSDNNFFSSGIFSDRITIDQNQVQIDDQTNYQASVNYTEPLGRKKYIQLNYTRQNFSNDLDKDFFDIAMDGTPVFNAALSTRYKRDYYYDRGGINLLANFKNSSLNLSVNAQNSSLKGNITDERVEINRDFFNILPALSWKINFAQSRNLRLNYSTSIREPSLRQLQPFVDNSNPLSVYTGNPDLKVEYRHDLRLNYLLFDNFSFTSLFVTLSTSVTANKITNATEIDEFLRQRVRPININNEVVATSFISFGTPIKPIGMKINLDYRGSGIRSQLFVNGTRNKLTRWVNNVNFKIENRKKKVMDIALGVRLSFNDTKYSNNAELDQFFVNSTLTGALGFDLKKKWNFNTSLDYTTYTGDIFNNTQEIALWRAEISRSFLKFDRGQLKLSALDLLNQNRGINRNSSFNYIEDERQNALGRYFMVSFTYSLR